MLLLVQVAFATLSVEGKLAMSPGIGIDPAAMAMARILGGAVAFVSLGLVARAIRPGSLVEVAKLAGLSALGVVVNQALFLRGLRQTSPLSATVLVATIPVFAALASALLGRERLGARTAAGLSLAVLGIGVLSRFHVPALGDLFVLANALSYAIYLALAQPTVRRLGPLATMGWVFGLGALLFLPWGGAALVRDAPRWSPAAWGFMAFIVLVPTIFAYLGNAWALARATPSQVAVYVYFQPMIVAALAWAQLGQPIEPRIVAAGALILLGVTLVLGRGPAAPRGHAEAGGPPAREPGAPVG